MYRVIKEVEMKKRRDEEEKRRREDRGEEREVAEKAFRVIRRRPLIFGSEGRWGLQGPVNTKHQLSPKQAQARQWSTEYFRSKVAREKLTSSDGVLRTEVG